MTKRYSDLTYMTVEVAEEYGEFADYFTAEVFGELYGEELLTPARERLFVADEADALVFGPVLLDQNGKEQRGPDGKLLRDAEGAHLYELLPPDLQLEWASLKGDDPLQAEKRAISAEFQQAIANDPDRGPAVLRKAMALAEQQARAAIEEERVKRLGVFGVPVAGGLGL